MWLERLLRRHPEHAAQPCRTADSDAVSRMGRLVHPQRECALCRLENGGTVAVTASNVAITTHTGA